MEIQFVATGRGTIAVRVSGPEAAPLVVLLHGFPDDASTFDDLAAELAAAGWRCAAPYLRGYAPSPIEGDLGLEGLADDLLAIGHALSPDAPHAFVGHDYGGQIGCIAMTRAPSRFTRAVLMAAPHPAIIARNAARVPRQWWLSRYILFFQLGGFADRRVARDKFAYVDKLWRRWSPSFTPKPSHLQRVKATLAASMPLPVAMYRAGDFNAQALPVSVPTLAVAGAVDGCVDHRIYSGQGEIFSGGYDLMVLDGTGHFPHLEVPERTSALVGSWLTNAAGRASRDDFTL